MIKLQKNKITIIGFIISLLIPVITCSYAKAVVQGSTLAGDYFLYADITNKGVPGCRNSRSETYSCRVNIYKCKVKNTSSCTKIVKNAKLGHANALDYQWDTGYFAVFDGWCNPVSKSDKKFCYKGCYDLKGHRDDSKCKMSNNNSSHICNRSQGYAHFKSGKTTYSLKGSDQCRGGNGKIDIFKNNKYNTSISVSLHGCSELEDVMVDKNGKIYYTVIKNGKVHLYKTSKKLPAPDQSGVASTSSQEIKKYKGSHISPANPKKIKAKNSSANTESQYDGSVDTIFFGKVEGDDKGCGVSKVLVFIIEILTYGIGITAVIGISVFGIMYLTAGGDAAKTTKAKKRILEIVIGIVLYSVLWALLNFLLPGGKLNSADQCSKADQPSSRQYIA